MLRFTLGRLMGVFEDGTLIIVDDGDMALGFQELLQDAIDYNVRNHEGYMPGMDASARQVLLGVGATITHEDTLYEPGAVY